MEREFPQYDVRCSWQTSFDDEVWARFVEWATALGKHEEAGGFEFESVEGFSFGQIVGDSADDRVARIDVRRDENTLEFSLHVVARPDDEPPASTVELNAVIGGRRGLQAVLNTAVGRAPQIADYRIQALVPCAKYGCPLVPRRLSSNEHAVVGDLASSASREQVGFRFESGSLGLRELVIIYLHETDEFLLRVEGRNPLRLGARRWLPLADELLALVFGRVFEELAP